MSESTEQHHLDRRRALTLGATALAGAAVLSACGASEEKQAAEEARESQVGESPAEDLSEKITAALDEVAARYEGAEFSMACYDHQTDRLTDYHPEVWTYEASVVKVPIALSTMRLAARGGGSLTQNQRDLISMSVGYSDNSATETLFGELGTQGAHLSNEGPDDPGQPLGSNQQDIIQAASDQMDITYEMLGVERTRANGTWGDNQTWAMDQLQIIRTIIDGVDWVNADDMEFLSSTMTPEDSSQNWGVGVMIGDQVNGTDVLDVDVKNGWLPDEEGWWYINSMGAVILPEAAYSVAVAAKGFPDEQTGYDAASEMVRAYFTAKFSD